MQTDCWNDIGAPHHCLAPVFTEEMKIIPQDHYWTAHSSSPILCIIYKNFHPSLPSQPLPHRQGTGGVTSNAHSFSCPLNSIFCSWLLSAKLFSLYVNVKLSWGNFYADRANIKMLLVNITISLVIYFRSGRLRAILGDVWMNILQDKRHQALFVFVGQF